MYGLLVNPNPFIRWLRCSEEFFYSSIYIKALYVAKGGFIRPFLKGFSSFGLLTMQQGFYGKNQKLLLQEHLPSVMSFWVPLQNRDKTRT
jgi:hypothetical protein